MDLTVILSFISAYLSVPSIALLVMFCGAFYVLKAAQRREDFDLGNMFKNEAGKESVVAMGAMIAIILSGWVLVYDTVTNGVVDQNIYLIYLAIWSGSKVAEKLVEALAAKWTK